MNAERWRQVKRLFGEALERRGEERAPFLDRACAADAELRREVESLLASHDRAGGFLDGVTAPRGPALPPEAGPPATGRIGPYRLTGEIGRGGMGTVHRAVRADQEFQQEVAIKLIRAGMASDFTVARFRNERQILASLVHPNIAALLDGGSTEDGLPYFVMEHVDGEPIDAYCDAHRLSIPRRLELFLAVCAAVQHAHARLVVHRDLKPGNILVTRAGVPKLLDFGIAKLLDPGVDRAEQTVAPARFATPAFASPEQLRGEPVTTASDVFSLGALLYLLLTGRRPFGAAAAGHGEVMRAVCEAEPERPSAVVRQEPPGSGEGGPGAAALSALRGATPERLGHRLAGDIDTIVLQALRKEPERRYASVEQLADDLRRHLQELPVLARPNRLAYRARKFLARHRAGVAAAVLVALSAGGAVHETSRQRARAERRFQEVRRLANSFLFEFHEAIRDLPGSTRARELLVVRAREYLGSLAEEAAGDTGLQSELADAWLKLGELQGGRAASADDLPGAIASFREELRLREAVVRAAPQDPRALRYLARALDDLGMTRLQLRDEGGLEEVRRALRLREELLARAPGSLDALRDLARSHDALAYAAADRGDPLVERGHREEQVALCERIAAADPRGRYTQRNLAVAYRWLSEVLRRTGEPVRARDLAARSAAIDGARVAASPDDATAKGDLAYDHATLSRAQALLGDLDGALGSHRRAVALAEELARADAASTLGRQALFWAHAGMGEGLLGAGRVRQARDELGQAAAIARDLLSRGPRSWLWSEVARLHARLGSAEAELARSAATPSSQRAAHWRAARDWYRRSQETHGELRAAGRWNAEDARNWQANLEQLARCEEALGGGGPGERGERMDLSRR